MKRLTDFEMQRLRDIGNEEASSEEGLRLKMRVLSDVFVDFVNPNFVAEERNSSADVCRDERSLFSISR